MEKNKNYKKLSIHTLLIVDIILLAAISLQAGFAATTYNINNTDPGGINGTLNGADDGDTIILDEGTYTGNNNTNIMIKKNITIQGKTKDKVIIDAQGLSRIFEIDSYKNVIFINITFINGKSSPGGAILAYNNMITFINCTFINNSASTNVGGAIFSLGNLDVINSTFMNNTALNGAAIYFIPNNIGIYNVNIYDSIFTDNIANYSSAVYLLANSKDIIVNADIKNLVFNNNSGGIGSGGLAITATGDILNANLTNSTFINNTGSIGGGLSVSTGDNGSVSLCIRDSNFTNNAATNNGGGMSVSSGNYNSTIDVCIHDSNFIGNVATNKGGGLILNSNGNCSTNITISNSNIKGNSANETWGGGIHINSNSGLHTKVTISDSEIIDNEGNGIYNDRSDLNINGSIVSNNTGNGITTGNVSNSIITDCLIVSNDGYSISGNGSAVMNDNTISSNIDQETVLSISSSVSNRTISVTVRVIDIIGNVLVGATVNFYINGVLVGTGTTNSEGIAQFTYTVANSGTYIILTIMDAFTVIDTNNNTIIYTAANNTTTANVFVNRIIPYNTTPNDNDTPTPKPNPTPKPDPDTIPGPINGSNDNPKTNHPKSSNGLIAKASMKSTGIPIPMLLALLSAISFVAIRRKQN